LAVRYLQLNDGTLFTKFTPIHKRVENGVQTTNNQPVCRGASGTAGLRATIPWAVPLRHLCARRLLVDEDAGWSRPRGSSTMPATCMVKLTDGTSVRSGIDRWLLPVQLFKLRDSRADEASFITVPCNVPACGTTGMADGPVTTMKISSRPRLGDVHFVFITVALGSGGGNHHQCC
jgi:hypothetical protein